MEETLKTPEASDICQALRSDASNTYLAREFGVHKETIVAWRRKYGIPRFVPRARCREMILKVLRSAHSREGLFLSELVEHCQASRQKLYWILKDMEREGLIYAVGATNARRWFVHL